MEEVGELIRCESTDRKLEYSSWEEIILELPESRVRRDEERPCFNRWICVCAYCKSHRKLQ